METKYTIKDLKNGDVILYADTTVEELCKVLRVAFPYDTDSVVENPDWWPDYKYYNAMDDKEWNGIPTDEIEGDGRPIVNVSDLIKQITVEEEPKLIRRFKSGAVRSDSTGRPRPDWLSPFALEEISKVLVDNENDFGACNYMLGIDETACLESMMRHVLELQEAMLIHKDMSSAKVIARSVGFNVISLIHTLVLKEKGLYKEHFNKTELVTVEQAKQESTFTDK